MSLGPFVSEVIHDPQFDQLVEHVTRRPAMYVNPPTLAGVMAYIAGYDHGRGGSPLLGLREWLVVRARGWNNFHWTGLVCREIAGTANVSSGQQNDPELLIALGHILQEYLAYRAANGLSKVFWDYAEWLRGQDWYSGPLAPPAASRDAT